MLTFVLVFLIIQYLKFSNSLQSIELLYTNFSKFAIKHKDYDHCYVFNYSYLICMDPFNSPIENQKIHPSYLSYQSLLQDINKSNRDCFNYSLIQFEYCNILLNDINGHNSYVPILMYEIKPCKAIGNELGYVFDAISFVMDSKMAIGMY